MTLWGGGEHRYLAARQSRAESDVVVSLYVTKNFSGGPSRHRTMARRHRTQADGTTHGRPRRTRPAARSRKRRQLAVYGLLFDFDKETIRPDSKPQLDEIGRLLMSSPALKVLIVGHTDSKGSCDYNLDLSRRHAASVVAALVHNHGIAPDRLTPIGVGMAAPLANNRTEAGQGRNRRVELVER